MTTAAQGTPETTPVQRRYDVFLSYARRDWPTVERIGLALRRERLTPWLDRWCLSPGGRWQDELAAGLAASRSCAVFVGPGDLGAWERLEIELALDELAHRDDFRLFPVLLPEMRPLDLDALPPLLRMRTWVDLRDGGEALGLDQLIRAIDGVPLGPHVALEPSDDVCPYRGLSVFEERHESVFFGREHEVQRVLERLRYGRAVAVLGASGSGKSSLVRAGVVPALRRREPARVCIIRPGPHPLEALAAATVTLAGGGDAPGVLDSLARDDRALHLAVGRVLVDANPAERGVIVIDQLEEAFTLCASPAERERAFGNLVYAATCPGGRCVVVLALRSDFYPRLAEHPELMELVEAAQEVVGPLGAAGLREAIESPARLAGLQLEPGLATTILGDAGSAASTLPLLQYALVETWRRRHGGILTLAGYRDSGGVQGALAARADAIYDALDGDAQDAVRRVLLRLTQPGEGVEDTRRRAPLAELLGAAGDREVVASVIGRLTEARLLTSGGGDDGETWVEVAHEALIRGWPTLHRWIDDGRVGLVLQRRLTDSAVHWRAGGRDESELFFGTRLAQALEWVRRDHPTLTGWEREFLAASVRRAQRDRRARTRRAGVALVALVATLVAIGSFGLVALHQKHVAESRELAARSTTLLDVDPGLSLNLALAAYDTAHTAAAKAAVRQAALGFNQRHTFDVARVTVWAAALSPNGARAVSVDDHGTAKLWDTSGGAPLAQRKWKGPLYAVRWSPDGREMAFGGKEGRILLAGASPRSAQPVDVGAHGALVSLAFSGNGRRLAAGFLDGTVVVLSGRRVLRTLHDGQVYVPAVALDGDGTRVAAGSGSGTVKVWTVADRHGPATLLPASTIPPWTVAFRPGTNELLAAGADGRVRIWNTVTKAVVRDFAASDRAIYSAVFTRDGARFLTAGQDGTARVWSVLGGSPLTEMRGQGGLLRSVGIDAASDLAVTAGDDGVMRTWRVPRATVERWPGSNGVSFSPDGRLLAAGGFEGVGVWNVATGKQVATLPARSPDGMDAAFGGTGDRLVVTTDTEILVWTPGSRSVTPVASVPATAAALDPSSGRVVYSHGAGPLIVHSLQGGRPDIKLAGAGEEMSTVTFSPDGTKVAAGGRDGMIRVWRIARPGAPELTRQGLHGIVNAIAFSPDGRRLVAAGIDGAERTIDLANGRQTTLLGNREDATSAEFTPGGAQILTASKDGTARLWSAGGGEPLVTLEARDQPLDSASFSPRGPIMASVGDDGTVRIATCRVCGPISQVLALARSLPRPRFTEADRRRYLSAAS